jgi:hypothetical protein
MPLDSLWFWAGVFIALATVFVLDWLDKRPPDSWA